MARRSKPSKSSTEENIESSGPAAVPGSDAIPEGEVPYDSGEDKPASPKKAAAEKVLAESAKPAAVKKFYRVTKGGMVRAETGHRTRMHEGKVVDTSNYNIERLRQQGVKMEEIDEEDARFG